MFVLQLVVALLGILGLAAEMPLPWSRELELEDPPIHGNDVVITQNLLNRAAIANGENTIFVDGIYGETTVKSVKQFQVAALGEGNTDYEPGVVDEATAQVLLDKYSNDNVIDDGASASDMGDYQYKFSIPVSSNRSIETKGRLFDANNRLLHEFIVRAHGKRDDNGAYAWPDFGSVPGDVGLNQFTSSGNTPTGVVEVDLNSPEPNPQVYGPWPVNRIVRGVKGNAAFLLPSIRDGVLMHTGNWTTAEHGIFDPRTMTMPNSDGCLHLHPEDIERIYRELMSIGVTVNDNPFSGKDYPFKPQGVAVIYLV